MTLGIPNLRQALRHARGPGFVVQVAHRTGELVVYHPDDPHERVRVNARRKDATRALLWLIRSRDAGCSGTANTGRG